jgi:hypothetical protein
MQTLSGSADTTKSTLLNQGELKPLLGIIKSKPDLVDWGVVAKCEDELAALQLCVHLSRLHYETLAFKLGIDKGHFSRIMQGHGHLPARKRTQLMSICGNLAPVQFDCLKFGFKLKEHDVDAELSEIEQRRAFLLATKQHQVAVAA